MIQPYLQTADAPVVFIDGEISHGMRKGPMLSPGEPPESGLTAAPVARHVPRGPRPT